MNALVEKATVDLNNAIERAKNGTPAIKLIARVVTRTETEEGDSPRLTIALKRPDGSRLLENNHIWDRIVIQDANGFQVGDEFDVTFTPRAKTQEKVGF